VEFIWSCAGLLATHLMGLVPIQEIVIHAQVTKHLQLYVHTIHRPT